MQYLGGWIGTSLAPDAAQGLLSEQGERTVDVGHRHVFFSSLGMLHKQENVSLAYTGRPTIPTRSSPTDIGDQIIELYRTYSENFLAHVEGAFSLALYDQKAGQLTLAVDRIGVITARAQAMCASIAPANRTHPASSSSTWWN